MVENAQPASKYSDHAADPLCGGMPQPALVVAFTASKDLTGIMSPRSSAQHMGVLNRRRFCATIPLSRGESAATVPLGRKCAHHHNRNTSGFWPGSKSESKTFRRACGGWTGKRGFFGRYTREQTYQTHLSESRTGSGFWGQRSFDRCERINSYIWLKVRLDRSPTMRVRSAGNSPEERTRRSAVSILRNYRRIWQLSGIRSLHPSPFFICTAKTQASLPASL